MDSTKRNIISVASLIAIIVLLIVVKSIGGNRRPAEPSEPVTPTELLQATKVPTKKPTPKPTEAPKVTDAPEVTEAPTPTPTATPVPTQLPLPTAAPEYVAAAQKRLDTMSVDEKLYQLFVVTPEQLIGVSPVMNALDRTRRSIQDRPVGGLIFSAQNIANQDQLKKLLAGCQNYSKRGLFLVISDETGSVTSGIGTHKIDTLATIGASGDVKKAETAALALGRDLKSLGFSMNLAPVSDIQPQGSSTFGTDAKTTASFVASYVKGCDAAGMPAVLSHFPVPASKSEKKLSELKEAELLTFLAGMQAGAPVVMVGYADMTGLSASGLPACLCPEVIDGLLRKELGYQRVVMTDALNKPSITDHYNAGDAAVLAFKAGADLLYRPADLDAAFKALQAAIKNGTITEARLNESVLRILTLKAQYGMIK